MNAKQFFLSLLFLTISFIANAQWQTNSSSIYYNNGNVGIGTSSPRQKLEVKGKIWTDDIIINTKIGRDLSHPFTIDGVTLDEYSLGWVDDPKIPSA